MNHVSHFVWLAEQALGGVAFLWPVSLGLFAALIAAVVINTKRGRVESRGRLAWLAMPLLGTFLMLVVGVVFARTEAMAFLPYVMLAAVFVLCVWMVYKARGFRITATAVSLQILWLSLWCGFVTVMSITGDWL